MTMEKRSEKAARSPGFLQAEKRGVSGWTPRARLKKRSGPRHEGPANSSETEARNG